MIRFEDSNQYEDAPNQLRENGFTHTQLDRSGDVALFERIGTRHSRPHYEVVVISRHNGYELAGVKIEPAECYPSPESWGTRGFTFNELDKAVEKFTYLCLK